MSGECLHCFRSHAHVTAVVGNIEKRGASSLASALHSESQPIDCFDSFVRGTAAGCCVLQDIDRTGILSMNARKPLNCFRPSVLASLDVEKFANSRNYSVGIAMNHVRCSKLGSHIG